MGPGRSGDQVFPDRPFKPRWAARRWGGAAGAMGLGGPMDAMAGPAGGPLGGELLSMGRVRTWRSREREFKCDRWGVLRRPVASGGRVALRAEPPCPVAAERDRRIR